MKEGVGIGVDARHSVQVLWPFLFDVGSDFGSFMVRYVSSYAGGNPAGLPSLCFREAVDEIVVCIR